MKRALLAAATAAALILTSSILLTWPPAIAQTPATPDMFEGGTSFAPGLEVKRVTANVAASQTDQVLVAAVAGKRIRVLGVLAVCGDTATALTFNTKGSEAGTAISPAFPNGANGGFATPLTPPEAAWFVTNSGEALTCTTGAGATTAIQVLYVEQ